MNRSTIKLTLAALLLGSTFMACKKDTVKDEPQPCTISMQSLAGSYKLTALQYKQNNNAAGVDYLVFMDACEKDDLVVLNANGTYNYKDMGVVCLPSQDDAGTWSVTGSTLSSDGVMDGTISSFDCKTLVYYAKDVYTAGDRLIFTMVKQ
jgi:Lipocalin-like domain